MTALPLDGRGPGRKYLEQTRKFSYFSWYETATLTLQTDALFFLDVISPLQK